MKLLLDENISWRIVEQLKPYFNKVEHINFTELQKPIKDFAIWNYALENNFIIVTNDKDFIDFLNINGFPPKVIVLITGNQSSKYLSKLIINKLSDIEQLFFSDEYGILEIF